jgi:hypothetical protein
VLATTSSAAGGLGLALLLHQGAAAWIVAHADVLPSRPPKARTRADEDDAGSLHGELVTLIAQMVLGRQRSISHD